MTKTLPIKVYYEDTDAGGIVYHAQFLNFFERGRTEFLAECGFSLKQCADLDCFFVVRHISIDYLAPARLEDKLEVVTQVEPPSGAKLIFNQKAVLNGKELASAKVTVVAINGQFKPCSLPEALKRSFE